MIEELLAAAGLPPPVDAQPLGGGTYNTVLRVATAAGDVVVKLAPDPDQAGLTYERGIMATEALYYRLAHQHGVGSVPRVLHHGRAGGTEALVMSLCPGRPWPEAAPDETLRPGLRAEVGRELAALHRITGPGFGYPARPLHPTWREAFLAMFGALLDDAVHYGVTLPLRAPAIAGLVERVSPALDGVRTPALVHFDLWDGNILVDGPLLGGLIDAERAFWGDPLAELVSLRLFGDLEPDPGLLAGYTHAGGELVLDDAARLRLTLYRLYLFLIMWVEAVPRSSDSRRVAWLETAVLTPVAEILEGLGRRA